MAFAAVLAASLLLATAARADTGVIPDTPDLPWADPDHRSPLEVLSSQIASQIAGRDVRVYCNGTNDWEILRAQQGIPENVWGYVLGPQFYYIVARTFVDSSPDTKLSPIACQYLWNFAKASAKPTKCDASTLAKYYVTEVYPRRQTENPDYWSPDCVQNGPLDQTPGDGIWP